MVSIETLRPQKNENIVQHMERLKEMNATSRDLVRIYLDEAYKHRKELEEGLSVIKTRIELYEKVLKEEGIN